MCSHRFYLMIVFIFLHSKSVLQYCKPLSGCVSVIKLLSNHWTDFVHIWGNDRYDRGGWPLSWPCITDQGHVVRQGHLKSNYLQKMLEIWWNVLEIKNIFHRMDFWFLFSNFDYFFLVWRVSENTSRIWYCGLQMFRYDFRYKDCHYTKREGILSSELLLTNTFLWQSNV